MAAIAGQAYGLGLGLLLLNRLLDGLDGALARHAGISDLGGFLDIVADFIIYAGVPFAFALADPATNALPAAFLIFSFVGSGSSFLTFAIMAAKRGIATDLRGRKSLYYLGGLTEGAETIGALVLACLWPALFPWIALAFGLLCWLTTATRITVAWQTLR
jgi:phosphatidylglycerophosphate synthase